VHPKSDIEQGTNVICCPTKINVDYAYVGLDWTTGSTTQKWLFPDDSRKWNALGGLTTILEDGDLHIGGAFAIKRQSSFYKHPHCSQWPAFQTARPYSSEIKIF
jgi:hypothetical protein